MNSLLIDEPPLVVLPSLVRLLGDHVSALLLQQVHYRSRIAVPDDNGVRWAVATTDEWCNDVVIGPAQFKRAIRDLTVIGVLVTAQRGSYNRTAWRRVDYDLLRQLVLDSSEASVSKPPDGDGEHDTDPSVLKPPDVPTSREVRELQEEPSVEPSADAVHLTTNQKAKILADGYWKWYRNRHDGKDPMLAFMALRNLIVAALNAHHDGGAIKRALIEMHDRGMTLSKQSLDRQLTRPGFRSGQPGVIEQLSALQFDDDGRLKP